MPMRTVARSPRIVDGSRRVHPSGVPTAALVLLGLLALLPLLLAVVDDRSGFRLVMLSLALYAGMLVVALSLWARSLRERLVRIATTGPLRFTPPVRVRAALWLVPTIGMLPAVANLLVHTLGLPTMGGRLLEWGPYALGLVSLVGLVRELVALRTPLGLLVDGRGLHGVRGSASIEASWDEIDTVDVVGPHGPKLAISIVGQTPAIIDAHRLGSDPASVVRVLAFFRDHPDQRPSLADGMTAMQIVTGELQP
ncbi:hypothetical protein [Microbacterium sp. Leaf320]|uniref:hypothetical protein n=1 Tax=Microbacterium sp. Leaf320 TaxID=1736334 RepID=UPI0006F5BCB9|nr:hypothetical protein [Microbacterium sp. Leaf320]KQQ67293.1 hypothetical protein ASF63_08825 [Microbacterium sp. Leaf320]